jgi:hypothetical protein
MDTNSPSIYIPGYDRLLPSFVNLHFSAFHFSKFQACLKSNKTDGTGRVSWGARLVAGNSDRGHRAKPDRKNNSVGSLVHNNRTMLRLECDRLKASSGSTALRQKIREEGGCQQRVTASTE